MKKVISSLVLVVFCVSLFSPPLAARNADPTRGSPYVGQNGEPTGDDFGWNDPDSTGGRKINPVISCLQVYVSKYIFIYFIPKKVEKHKPLVEDDPVDLRNTGGR
jgi:hypothetical protein